MQAPAPAEPGARSVTPASREYPNMAWPTLARTAGRHAGGRLYDDLARLVTAGECDATGLLEAARRGSAPQTVDVRGLAWFAHVTASRVENPDRFADVAALFDLGHRLSRRRVFLPQLDDVWLQSAFLAGRLDELTEVMRRGSARETTWWTVETDAAHPGEVTAASREWLDRFNEPLLERGLEPVTVREGAGAAFDRLDCAAPRLPEDGETLVSVVIPVYNPGPSLRTAVGSLLAQTWPALEIVLADDCSSAGTDLIAELAASDPRVRHVRAPRNAGAYAARNLGMGVARGRLVTFNDADDWAHPRKIERQVRALEATPTARASMSWSIRVFEDLRLTVIGRDTRRVNLSSILVDRVEVLERLGGFDGVRKGADSEFVSRFLTAFGAGSIAEVTDPLSLVQLTSGSLSRDDYQFLRTHPARTQYVAAFRSWHRSLTGRDDVFVAPGTRAPFPAPPAIAGRAGTAPTTVDVLLLANPSSAAPTVPDLSVEVEALAGAGLRVGLREFVSPFDVTASVRPAAGRLARAFRRSDAVQVPATDEVAADLVVVRDPAAVETMGAAALGTVRAARVLVVADYSPAGGRHYDPAAVSRTLRSALTEDVRWLPATAGLAGELRAAVGDDTVLAPALFGALAPLPARTVPWHGHGPADAGPRTARRRVALYPGETDGLSIADLDRQVGALVPRTEVELVGLGAGRLAGALEQRATFVARPEHVSMDDLLTAVDVVLVGPSRGRGGHTHRVATLAMRHGCAVVIGPEFRDHLGDAACYLDDADVTTWVDRLVTEPGLVDRVVARGEALVTGALGPDRLVATVVEVLGDATVGRAA